tara:strand:- start:384 stop:557 length:174 start_codon:yes stop_codon:yes gene_type:complete
MLIKKEANSRVQTSAGVHSVLITSKRPGFLKDKLLFMWDLHICQDITPEASMMSLER